MTKLKFINYHSSKFKLPKEFYQFITLTIGRVLLLNNYPFKNYTLRKLSNPIDIVELKETLNQE